MTRQLAFRSDRKFNDLTFCEFRKGAGTLADF